MPSRWFTIYESFFNYILEHLLTHPSNSCHLKNLKRMKEIRYIIYAIFAQIWTPNSKVTRWSNSIACLVQKICIQVLSHPILLLVTREFCCYASSIRDAHRVQRIVPIFSLSLRSLRWSIITSSYTLLYESTWIRHTDKNFLFDPYILYLAKSSSFNILLTKCNLKVGNSSTYHWFNKGFCKCTQLQWDKYV